MDGENDEVRGEEEGDYEEKYDDEESTACEYTDEGWDQQAMEEGEDNQEVADDQEPAEELDEHCLDDVVEEEDEVGVRNALIVTTQCLPLSSVGVRDVLCACLLQSPCGCAGVVWYRAGQCLPVPIAVRMSVYL